MHTMVFHTYKLAAIRHEVAHWMVALKLGYPVGDIRVRIDRGTRNGQVAWGHDAHAHIDLHPTLKSMEDVERYLRDRISILTVGVLYQDRYDDRNVEEIWDTDGDSDRQKYRELCFVLRGMKYPDTSNSESEQKQTEGLLLEIAGEALNLLDQSQAACDFLASRIAERVYTYGREFPFGRDELIGWLREVEPSTPIVRNSHSRDVPANI